MEKRQLVGEKLFRFCIAFLRPIITTGKILVFFISENFHSKFPKGSRKSPTRAALLHWEFLAEILKKFSRIFAQKYVWKILVLVKQVCLHLVSIISTKANYSIEQLCNKKLLGQ